MGAIHIADDLHHAIERLVHEGRAATPTAFVAEAVQRLIEDTRLEEDDIKRRAAAGIADIEAGRYTLIDTPRDNAHLHERLMAELEARLTTEQ